MEGKSRLVLPVLVGLAAGVLITFVIFMRMPRSTTNITTNATSASANVPADTLSDEEAIRMMRSARSYPQYSSDEYRGGSAFIARICAPLFDQGSLTETYRGGTAPYAILPKTIGKIWLKSVSFSLSTTAGEQSPSLQTR